MSWLRKYSMAVWLCVTLTNGPVVFGQQLAAKELLQLLSDPRQDQTNPTRMAIERMRASTADFIPLLLRWTTNSPRGIPTDVRFLFRGMVDVFSEFKVREPFRF